MDSLHTGDLVQAFHPERKIMRASVKPTIAVIGIDIYQKQLFEEARESGYRTIAFLSSKDVRCRELPDKYYDIPLIKIKEVLQICKREHVVGVVSNVLDENAELVSIISIILGLHRNPYDNFLKL